MVKFSSLIIGILFIGLIMTLFGIFMSDVAVNYANPEDFNKSTTSLNAYNKFVTLHNKTQNIQERTLGIEENPSITDKVGFFIGQGFDTLRIAFQSYDVFDEVANQATEDSSLGSTGSHIKTVLSLIVLISLLFLLISALVKWEL